MLINHLSLVDPFVALSEEINRSLLDIDTRCLADLHQCVRSLLLLDARKRVSEPLVVSSKLVNTVLCRNLQNVLSSTLFDVVQVSVFASNFRLKLCYDLAVLEIFGSHQSTSQLEILTRTLAAG